MAGIGQKIKDVAHKVTGTGTHAKEDRHAATGTGATYGTTGATYGTAGEMGMAAPMAAGAHSDVMGQAGTDVGFAAEGGELGAGATGYTERREGYAEVPVVQQTTTTTTAGMAEKGVAAAGAAAPETCAQEYFTKVEDRPVVKERVELVQEHRPVEKEFVVETRATGAERGVGGGEVEHLGTTERVVGVTQPKAPCE